MGRIIKRLHVFTSAITPSALRQCVYMKNISLMI